MNPRRSMPRNILIKLTRIKNKEKILKTKGGETFKMEEE